MWLMRLRAVLIRLPAVPRRPETPKERLPAVPTRGPVDRKGLLRMTGNIVSSAGSLFVARTCNVTETDGERGLKCATVAYDGVRGTWKPSSEMGIGEYCGQKALGCPLVGASASTLCVCAERDNVVNTSAECNAGGSLARWRACSLALVLCVAVWDSRYSSCLW